jgi:hypothetical protein
LHLIPQSNDLLFAKLADGLKPGGFLVFSMPKLSPYNRCLGIVRRCLRLTRSRLTDRMILMIARLLHGREKTDSFLLERVHYMYFLPHRVMDSAMERVLDEQFDLHCQGAHPYPHASIGQFKHGLWVFQKGQSSGLVDAKAA